MPVTILSSNSLSILITVIFKSVSGNSTVWTSWGSASMIDFFFTVTWGSFPLTPPPLDSFFSLVVFDWAVNIVFENYSDNLRFWMKLSSSRENLLLFLDYVDYGDNIHRSPWSIWRLRWLEQVPLVHSYPQGEVFGVLAVSRVTYQLSFSLAAPELELLSPSPVSLSKVLLGFQPFSHWFRNRQLPWGQSNASLAFLPPHNLESIKPQFLRTLLPSEVCVNTWRWGRPTLLVVLPKKIGWNNKVGKKVLAFLFKDEMQTIWNFSN